MSGHLADMVRTFIQYTKVYMNVNACVGKHTFIGVVSANGLGEQHLCKVMCNYRSIGVQLELDD